jgi:protein SCO1/2
MLRRAALAIALLSAASAGLAHEAARNERLPVIGPAPGFSLVSQDGRPMGLADLRGKVVAVTFIFASCTDTCPLLTDKMARIQDELGARFGSEIAFVSITVDPERDGPDVLKRYARSFGANLTGWTFLTGSPQAIADVTKRYGVFVSRPAAGGDIEHTFLTSLIDPHGMMRVQYLGVRFDPQEFRRDLLELVDEP